MLKLNISVIKYNSLFGTRAICSNIFQRMSRRYILKNTLEYKRKCRIYSKVVIKRVPKRVPNTTARWIKTNNTALLVLLYPLVTLRRSDPVLHRKHCNTSKFSVNIFSFKCSIRMVECVTVIPMLTNIPRRIHPWDSETTHFPIWWFKFFIIWYRTYQKVTYQSQLPPEQLIGAV